MSSGSSGVQVKKVVKKIVDDVVKELENLAEATQSLETEQQVLDSEFRRSSRCRKEPDRLAVNVKQSKLPKKAKKEDPFNFEIVMAPVPAHVRGILKPDRDFPPPRKSSLAVTAGKTIVKKYRKVRISRCLKYKVIPPLDGWRPDRSRMPDYAPDEEEQQRLEELEAREQMEAEAQRKRRKRKSIGISAMPSVSDVASMDDDVETSGSGDIARPQSPDIFYEGYIEAGNSDSDEVLSDDGKKIEEPRMPLARFTLKDDPVEPPIESNDRKVRRRSVRIQEREEMRGTMFLNSDEKKKKEPIDEVKPKTEERRERRKSKVFPVTPLKESPETKPVDKAEKSTRRKSGLFRPTKKEEASSSTNPFNDDVCRSEEQKNADDAQNMERKTKKVSAWLTRTDTAAAMAAGAASGSAADEIEFTRGTESCESQFSEASSNTRLIETLKSNEPTRKGRRSMMMTKEKKAKENEEVKSKSKSELEDKQKQHPFFTQFAPKSTQPVVAAVVPEKKQSRRRSMFVPKNSVTACKKEGTPEEEKEKEEEEDAIEVVAEITKEKEEQEKDPSQSGGTTASFWRSSEIDSAPYAGLVHVGREERKEKDGDCEEVVKKMRRLSVKLPRLSSYAIPSSLRSDESEPGEMLPIFDKERNEGTLDAAAVKEAIAKQKNIRPRKVEDCLGDTEVLASGKRWLQKWKKRLDAVCTEEENALKAPKAKRKKRKGGAYSDESEQEDSDSDYEEREEEHRLPNPLVLSGPIGCGKTAYIHALSEEVGFSILESSPDEKRTGSSLRTKLMGAVSNYRMSSKPTGGIASFFSSKTEGEEKKKKEGKRGRHTIIVIEHVDIVFTEEDKLFWPALSEILATSKIPIVLTCNFVPDELTRVLRQVEEGGVEPMEMIMGRTEGKRITDHIIASVRSPFGRSLSTTVVSGIVTRARHDLRAALRDMHWVFSAFTVSQSDLMDRSVRRIDEQDTVVSQTLAWTDDCKRRAEAINASELMRAAEWPARCGMPGDVYSRLCEQIDMIDPDEYRETKERSDRMMEMARSGVEAGSGGRSGLMTRREIAMDWMPILEQIDRKEQDKKKTYGRRHQHYFNVIKDLDTGVSIDPLDRIQGSCAFFRLPQSNDLQ